MAQRKIHLLRLFSNEGRPFGRGIGCRKTAVTEVQLVHRVSN